MEEQQALANGSDRVSWKRPFVRRGFETLAAHYVRRSFRPHAHSDYLIGVITGGVHSVWCRGERHMVSAGTVMTMRPGDVHHGNAAVMDGWVQRMIYVSEEVMEHILGDRRGGATASLPDFGVSNRRDPALAARLERLHDVIHASPLTLSRDVALAAFADVVAVLAGGDLDASAAKIATDYRAGRLVDYLQAHVTEDVGLGTLSSLVGLGRRQTIDLFKRRTGLPPHAYHIGLKVRLVQSLLCDGRSPSAAAAEAGFADQSHMTRHFTAIVGLTPAAYARA